MSVSKIKVFKLWLITIIIAWLILSSVLYFFSGNILVFYATGIILLAGGLPYLVIHLKSNGNINSLKNKESVLDKRQN
jgi:hypothetical protein